MRGRIETAFRTTCRWVDRVERLALAALVTGMVGLSSLQILLRNVWHTGLIWAEPLLGMALLWLTMLGALAAAGLGRHLSIDLVAALASKRVSVWITRATSGLAAAICVLLAWAAGRYVGFQREMDSTALLGWPLWKYDLINKTYQKMSDFPRVTGQADIPVLIIQKDNKIYANLDSYFFEYNPLSDSWNETGQTPMTPFAFYVNEIPYIGSMYLVSSLYRITESGDLIHTSNYPIAADSKIPHPLFQIDGKAYIVLKDQWSDYLDKAVYGSSFYMLTK